MLMLKPVDPKRPPDRLVLDVRLRGIAIYWPGLPVQPASPVKRRRKATPAAAPAWQVQRVGFHAVSADGSDSPPRDAAEQDRFVRRAYALVACLHPIPSDSVSVRSANRVCS
jgi:hypothetical protein